MKKAGAEGAKGAAKEPRGKVPVGMGEPNGKRRAMQSGAGAAAGTQEAAVLVKDSESFPTLAEASMPLPKGTWGTAGRWSAPLNLSSTGASGALGKQQQQQQSAARRADEDDWITVGTKPKAGGRTETAGGRVETASSQVHPRGQCAGAWGTVAWGAKVGIPESHGHNSAATKGKAAPPSAGAAGAGMPIAHTETKKTGKKAPILLSELMPVLRRKDVKMPTPYTSRQQAEADTRDASRKAPKRSDNLVRNPNAADGQGMVVLRRKEKEGGKKKTKVSPLKKLILRDRKERLARQAMESAADQEPEPEPGAPTLEQPADTSALQPLPQSSDAAQDDGGGKTEFNEGMDCIAGAGLGDEASTLAAEWLRERGMDASNPAHVQHLLNTLNEEEDEEEEEEEDGGGDESDEDEGAVQPPWTQLPSAVTWAGQVGSKGWCDRNRGVTEEFVAFSDRAHGHGRPELIGQEACGVSDEGSEGKSKTPSQGKSKNPGIPNWARVGAPEFRPGSSAGPTGTPSGPGSSNR